MLKRIATYRQSGFTIVELLIVIVVIAILAAISVVAYTGIQNRANDTAVQSDLRNIGQKIMEYQAVEGELPGNDADFTSIGLKATKSAYGAHYVPAGSYNMAWCPNVSTGTFAVVAASKSGNVYVFRNGAVNPGSASLVTILNTCTNNGHPSPSGSTWFYNSGSWRSYIGS